MTDHTTPAFPTTDANYSDPKWCSDGMTLRDYFAAKAMQGHMIGRSDFADSNKRTIAECAYDMADAMMEARK